MIRLNSLHPDLRQALYNSGWCPQRRVDAGAWFASLRCEGYVLNSKAEDILCTFGGLAIEPINQSGPNFANDEPFNFDPISAGAGQRGLALEIEEALGGSYFPIGEWLSYSSVFVESGGTVVAAGLGWIWGMGSSFEAALELAVCASRPLICLHSDPGLDPWPRWQ
ncbi:SUKH-3 domain-containing protein [Actinomadura geliboluensis]|uniref:SUKH-3 domain-containing protein n=1 Tax=Actinomadura geliboluensis TaxID=882440 RepID=UPI0037232E51